MKVESFLQSLTSGVLWKGLDRVLALLKHVVVASVIGLSSQLDVFYMLIAMLGVFVFSWSGLMDVVAIPYLVALYKNKNLDEFREVSGGVLMLCIIFSCFICIAIISLKGCLSNLAWGFEENRKEMIEDAIDFIIPILLLYIPMRFLGSILRSIRRFTPFYQSELIITIVSIIVIFLYADKINVIFIAFDIGVVFSVLFLIAHSHNFVRINVNPFTVKVFRIFHFAPALMILQITQYSHVLADRIFVSFLQVGHVSALAYGLSIVTLIPGVVSISGGFITVLSEYKGLDKWSGVGVIINNMLSMAILLGGVSGIYLLFFGENIVSFLLERGAFDRSDTELVSKGVSVFSLMMLPLFLMAPLGQVFQVEGRIDILVWRAGVGMVINCFLNYILIFIFEYDIVGVALATVISYWVMLVFTLQGLKKIDIEIYYIRHMVWFIWIIIICYLGAKITQYVFDIGVYELNDVVRMILELTLYILIVMTLVIVYRGEETIFLKTTILRLVSRS